MAKRGRKKRKGGRKKPTPPKSPQLGMSRHANVPRFLVMLTIAVGALLVFFVWVATGSGVSREEALAENAAATATTPAEAPAPAP